MNKLKFNSLVIIIVLQLNILHLFGQEIGNKVGEIEQTKITDNEKGYLPQATGDNVKVKDDAGNILLKVIDEGNFGSLELQNGVPSTTTNKLYNNSGTLHFNGSALGTSEINDLSDAIYDGSSLFIGFGCGVNDDMSSNYNTGIGIFSLYSNTTGYQNSAIGSSALNSNTTGKFNTADGYDALRRNITGNYNTAIGASAGPSSGYTNLHNTTCIGYNATVSSDNTIRLGDENIEYIYAKVGITPTSDSTKKENFLKVDVEEILNKFRQFKLTSWNFKTDSPLTNRHYGIMSQEFFSAFGQDELGTIGNDTTVSNTDAIGINMIAIQALEKRTTEQVLRIIELEKQNAELEKRLSKMEILLEERKLSQIIK